MRSFLVAHSQACPPEKVYAILNDTSAIATWIAPFPYSAIVTSHLETQDLAAVLRQRLPNIWLLVTEMNRLSADGWLPPNLWEYVNNPHQASAQQLLAQQPPPAPPASPHLQNPGLYRQFPID